MTPNRIKIVRNVPNGRNDVDQKPCIWAYTLEDAYIIVVYEQFDPDTIRVVTAYDVPELS